MIRAVRCLIERRQATCSDHSEVPSKQRVAGSDPAGRAHLKSQVNAYLAVAGTSGHDVSFALRAIRVPVNA